MSVATLTLKSEIASPRRRFLKPFEPAEAMPRTVSTNTHTKLFHVAFSPRGDQLAAGGEDGKAWLWDVGSGRRVSLLLDSQACVRSVAFANHGRTLVAAGGNWLRREGLLKTWNIADHSEEETLWRHNRPITAVAVSPDGRRLIAGSGDGLLRSWDLEAGEGSAIVQAHDDEIMAIAFAPNGRYLATAAADRTVKIWDAQLSAVRTLRGHERVVRSVVFDPTGQTLASVDEQTLLTWNAATGEIVHRREVPSGLLRAVFYSADSRTLFTAGNSLQSPSEIRRWDLGQATGKIVLRQTHKLTSLAVSSNQAHLAVGDDCGNVRIWPSAMKIGGGMLRG